MSYAMREGLESSQLLVKVQGCTHTATSRQATSARIGHANNVLVTDPAPPKWLDHGSEALVSRFERINCVPKDDFTLHCGEYLIDKAAVLHVSRVAFHRASSSSLTSHRRGILRRRESRHRESRHCIQHWSVGCNSLLPSSIQREYGQQSC